MESETKKIFISFVSIIIFLLRNGFCGLLIQEGSDSLLNLSANQGASGFYQFQFRPASEIPTNANIHVIFPREYSPLAFPTASNLECAVSLSQGKPFETLPCTMPSSGLIEIGLSSSLQIDLITVIIGQITNPAYEESSSQFRVRTLFNNVIVDSQDSFGTVPFIPRPRELEYAQVYRVTNQEINGGSTWEFNVSPSRDYAVNHSIRFTFPRDFRGTFPTCSVEGLAGNGPVSLSRFNGRIVECLFVNSTISSNLRVRVVNMVNPHYSGLFSPFKVEILKGSSYIVLESLLFAGNVRINPGRLLLGFEANNKFRWSNTTYTFFVNIINPVSNQDRLFLNFTAAWEGFFSPNCRLVRGFNESEFRDAQCVLLPRDRAYMIWGFPYLDLNRQFGIEVLFETPRTEGSHPVTISTMDQNSSGIVDLNTISIELNATLGRVGRFSASTIQSKAPGIAGKAVTLEMLFFLRIWLPPSDVDSFGKFRVDIMPKVPIPDASQVGPLECLYFIDVPSANDCSHPDSYREEPDRVTLYIQTPQDRGFHSSEVPIQVTTQGYLKEYYAGWHLDPLIQRYFFHIHIWGRNNTGIDRPAPNIQPDIPIDSPMEVYFAEYQTPFRIMNGPEDPDSIPGSALPNLPTYPRPPESDFTIRQIFGGFRTELEIGFQMHSDEIANYIIRPASERNYILRAHFIGSGWVAPTTSVIPVGQDTFYDYPCQIRGEIANNFNLVKGCDLVFRRATAAVRSAFYLQVNNINTASLIDRNLINIRVGGLMLNSLRSQNIQVQLELLEETPGAWEETFLLFQSQIYLLNYTQPNAPSVPRQSGTLTKDRRLLESTEWRFSFTIPSSLVEPIEQCFLEWDPQFPYEFQEVEVCSVVGASLLSCELIPQPVNWILIRGIGLETRDRDITIVIPSTVAQNPPHELTGSFILNCWGRDSLRSIYQASFSIDFPPMNTALSFLEPLGHPNFNIALNQTNLFRVRFQTTRDLPDGWSLLMMFEGLTRTIYNHFFELQWNLPNLSSLLLDGGLGFRHQFESETQVRIWNLRRITSGTQFNFILPLVFFVHPGSQMNYQIRFRLEYTATRTSPAVNIALVQSLLPTTQNRIIYQFNFGVNTWDFRIRTIFGFIIVSQNTILPSQTISIQIERQRLTIPGWDIDIPGPNQVYSVNFNNDLLGWDATRISYLLSGNNIEFQVVPANPILALDEVFIQIDLLEVTYLGTIPIWASKGILNPNRFGFYRADISFGGIYYNTYLRVQPYAFKNFTDFPTPDMIWSPFAINTNFETVYFFEYYVSSLFNSATDQIVLVFPENSFPQSDDSFQVGRNVTCSEMARGHIPNNMRCIYQVIDKAIFPGSVTRQPELQIQFNRAVSNERVYFIVFSMRNTIPSGFTNPVTFTIEHRRIAYRWDNFYLLSQNSTLSSTSRSLSFANVVAPLQTISSVSLSVSGVVWESAQTHSWSLNIPSLLAGDWISIIYPISNHPQLSETCTVNGSNLCFTDNLDPTIRRVTFHVSNPFNTFNLGNMWNGRNRGNNEFIIEHYRWGNVLQSRGRIIFQYRWHESGISLRRWPTLTPQETTIIQNYYMADFVNVVRFEYTGMWLHPNIEGFMFVITNLPAPFVNLASSEHNWCNATLTTTATPYPKRFRCQIRSPTILTLILTSDFPETEAELTSIRNFNLIVLYASIQIPEFPTIQSIQYQFIGFSGTWTNLNSVINSNAVTFNQGLALPISPYLMPSLRDVTFVQDSFSRRTGRTGEPVGFLILIEPMTQLALFRIDRLIFRIASEFQPGGRTHPLRLTGCTLRGDQSLTVVVTSCLVFYQFELISVRMDLNDYDNSVSIVEILDKDVNNLFKAPTMPGDFYNITVEMYSGGRFLETQTVNITRITGEPTPLTPRILFNHMDLDQLGVVKVEFITGTLLILQGYRDPSNRYYSMIQVSFSNIGGTRFQNDLGTRARTGDLIPCNFYTATVPLNGRIFCTLQVGSNELNPPRILVQGYEQLTPGSTVQLWFSQIRIPSVNAEVTTSILYFDTEINHSFIYQEPFTLRTTAGILFIRPPITHITMNIVPVVVDRVLELREYTFTFTGITVTPFEFIMFDFPKDYIDPNGNLRGITSSGTIGSFVISYRESTQIQVNPNSPVGAPIADITVILTDVPTPAYTQNTEVRIQASFISNSSFSVNTICEFVFNQAFNRPILPCRRFVRANSVSSSNIGSQRATFTFTIQTGHLIPGDTGSIQIQMPRAYPYSLNIMGVTCDLLNFPRGVTCEQGNSSFIEIILNGSELNQSFDYFVELHNMNTWIPAATIPNVQTRFQISSLFQSRTNRLICTADFPFPIFTPGTVFDCTILALAKSQVTSLKSLYTFSLTCDTGVPEEAMLRIRFPTEFETANASSVGQALFCQSQETTTLFKKECSLTRMQGFGFGLSVQIRAIPANTAFSILVNLINPRSSGTTGYSFSAEITYFEMLFATTTVNSLPLQIFQDNSRIQSPATQQSQIFLSNVPRTSGARATYILTIPPIALRISSPSVNRNVAVQKVRISFPFDDQYFSRKLGINLECGVFVSRQQIQFDYFNILNITSKSDPWNFNNHNRVSGYLKLTCAIVSDFMLDIEVPFDITSLVGSTAETAKNIEEFLVTSRNWQHWVIRNIRNPFEQNFRTIHPFVIGYYDHSSDLVFEHTMRLYYSISRTPAVLLIESIKRESSSLRAKTPYEFHVISESELPRNPRTVLSIRFPKQYFEAIMQSYTISSPIQNCVVSSIDLEDPTTVYETINVAECTVFGLELILYNVDFVKLSQDLESFRSIRISIDSLINSDVINASSKRCEPFDVFQILLLDRSSGDVKFATQNQLHLEVSCLEFVPDTSEIEVVGPASLLPGTSNKFTIRLARPANGMIVSPISDSENMSFSPSQIEFNDFNLQEMSFFVRVHANQLERVVFIRFNVTEAKFISSTFEELSLPPNGKLFKELLPLSIRIQEIDATNQPSIQIETTESFSVGYFIRIPITLSVGSPNSLSIFGVAYKRDAGGVRAEQLTTLIEFTGPQEIIEESNLIGRNSRYSALADELSGYIWIKLNTTIVPTYTFEIEFSIEENVRRSSHIISNPIILVQLSAPKRDLNTNKNVLRVNFYESVPELPNQNQNSEVLNVLAFSPAQEGNLNRETSRLIALNLAPQVVGTVIIVRDNVEIRITATAICTAFITYALFGYAAPSTSGSVISQTYEFGEEFLEIEVNQIVAGTDPKYFALLQLNAVQRSTRYSVYVVVRNEFGVAFEFHTNQFISNSIGVAASASIPIRGIILESSLRTALSFSLNYPEDLIEVAKEDFGGKVQLEDVTSQRSVFYVVVFWPDIAANSSRQRPSQVVQLLQEDNTTRNKLVQVLSLFDLQTKVQTNLRIENSPRFLSQPEITRLRYYDVMILVRLWKGYAVVFAVVVDYYTIFQNATGDTPSRWQVIRGVDARNQVVQSKRVVANDLGVALVEFDELRDDNQYVAFIVAASEITPNRLVFSQSEEVRRVDFSTLKNTATGIISIGTCSDGKSICQLSI